MPYTAPDATVFTQLQSSEHANLLDDIDRLRSQGISKYIDLPQLIVCGDQSSGKSSVLEAVSRVPFPVKDNLCTTFATELILRRSQTTHTAVSIRPGRSRTADEKQQLLAFRESFTSTSDIPLLIEAAKGCIAGLNASQPNAFSEDVLQIESSGPDRPHLSIVDLPGLIHSENRQQTAADVETVGRLVQKYMSNPRSIMLVVISAKNDHANQIVLAKARHVDPRGTRTLGVITKPDTLHAGSESEMAFVTLANNEDIKLELGWHVLKNRSFDMRDASLEERDETERIFFTRGIWASLPPRNVGAAKLVARLQTLLMQKIGSELPAIIGEIQSAINVCEEHRKKLGEPRTSLNAQRRYLMETSQEFHSLAKEAIKASYESDFFEELPSDEGYTKRLRAIVQNLNEDFAEEMHEKGHRYRIIADEEWEERSSRPSGWLFQQSESVGKLITRSNFIKKIAQYVKKNQGRELPGTFNPLLIGPVFQKQSAPWQNLASKHVKRVGDAVKQFLELALQKLMDRTSYDALCREVIEPVMEEKLRTTTRKLDEVLWPHQKVHPITHDRRFAQITRDIRTKSQLRRAFAQFRPEQFAGLDDAGISRLIDGMVITADGSLDRYACSEILDIMEAYYKIAINRFIDDVATVVIERCLLQDLANIYCPLSVSSMTDETVHGLAAESEDITAERELLDAKLKALSDGLRTCKRHVVRGPPGTSFGSLYQWDSTD
ncbi:hypothetical protein H2201_000502 [Coniosporium apollinis]|uniref:Dynamin GTPase n=2 Tax=Coniosporium TaxID=2810619 RepID=A0ABQ9P3I1_9PEZI|nr:hypothetical protein H2199_001232 [Cladosporium sp. JES 115]KAJ9669151.1 hypothetical protein H2201_000502 [Coniosporium apollinis]